MSRAFINEDAEGFEPAARVDLPPPDDPSYEAAAALALLEAAGDGQTHVAEEATGFRWGDPTLSQHVRRFLSKEEELPESDQNRRFIQVARRYLRAD